ncbi:CAP domain-containing protein [Nonomuraea sp. K274]|uniref:CAP domain-containing protein n=1 Tax=Nonomuraea cypriaca TaxID=1187855 RepID=A0A931F103_9ACTN|nr:CAP domain-containing protein [Nonomuraea cypriaca]MBF8189082.1 CAP domain-containing protein [Nonomuraea cypriaca]
MKVIALGIAALAAAGPTIATTPAAASAITAPPCVVEQKYYDRAPWNGSNGFWLSRAVHCLINAERAKAGLPPLTRRIATKHPLDAAAESHAVAAVRQKWWRPGADSHTNPQTGSTPASRVRGAGYCPNPRSWAVSEITYTGWGGSGTPKAAVHWWTNVSKAGHREIVLSPSLTDIGVGVRQGAADPAGAGASQAGTYVVAFGRCQQ